MCDSWKDWLTINRRSNFILDELEIIRASLLAASDYFGSTFGLSLKDVVLNSLRFSKGQCSENVACYQSTRTNSTYTNGATTSRLGKSNIVIDNISYGLRGGVFVVLHELGHAVSDRLGRLESDYVNGVGGNINDASWREYGKTNSSEAFAEEFAARIYRRSYGVHPYNDTARLGFGHNRNLTGGWDPTGPGGYDAQSQTIRDNDLAVDQALFKVLPRGR